MTTLIENLYLLLCIMVKIGLNKGLTEKCFLFNGGEYRHQHSLELRL
jgi:hypothetical protein